MLTIKGKYGMGLIFWFERGDMEEWKIGPLVDWVVLNLDPLTLVLSS